MVNLKRKLRSNRGASITFALLIFLVCAIVSGVVIVSASTAGGRMSGMRETDQRYFAATAAAHALQDKFQDKTVVITYNKAGDAYTMVSARDKSETDINDDILKDASWAVLTGNDYTHAEWSATNGNYSCKVSPKMTNGVLVFTITAGATGDNSKTYTLKILFTPNLKQPATGSNLTNAKATVTWSLNSLSRGQASQTTGG